MQGIGEVVAGWLEAAALRPAQASRIAGTSQSTMHRILHDKVDPTIGTVLEIAAACNIGIDLAGHPLSDPAAAAAARTLLEDGYPAPSEDEPDVRTWTTRLLRIGSLDQPLSIVERAGIAANPLARTGAHLITGELSPARIASAGQASAGRWALSGAAALDLATETPTDGCTILWCEDAVRAAQLLLSDRRSRSTKSATRATVAVIPATPVLFTNEFDVEQIRYCAPLQIVLDCISLGGALAVAALREARTW